MAHEILHPRNVHPAKGYSHVAKVGKTLYIAGQVAQDVEGNLVGKGDMEAQVRQVFNNLKLIMEDAGGNLRNIVKLTSFATHFSCVEIFRRIRGEFLREPFPPNTLVVVESLASADWFIEVEAIAVLD